MTQSTPTTSSKATIPEQLDPAVDSTTKKSDCTDPAHEKLPRHIHFNMPCFGRKPATDPNSTEPRPQPHKNIAGDVQGDGDMVSFGEFGVSDAGNGIGMEGPYPKGYDPTKPNNGLPPTPAQIWQKQVQEAQERAWGGK